MNRLILTLVAGLCAAQAPAQTFTTLKNFGVMTDATGFHPRSEMVQGPDGTLYGTMYEAEGNALGNVGGIGGTLYKMQPDGSGFTVLKWFINSAEGRKPYGGLTLSGNTLYGTAFGDSGEGGSVFKINTDGTGFTVLRYFGNSADATNGMGPAARLTLSGSTLYGTTNYGGSAGNGTLFKVNTDGTGFAVIKHFTGIDGESPYAGLTLSGSVLYGTTSSGGSANYGTVFKVNTDGTGFAVLKHFTGGVSGAAPHAALTLSGNVLYGATSSGGSAGNGTLFKLNTNGTGYTLLKHLTGSDGAGPYADLTLSGNTLYGTTAGGGSSSFGTVFKVQTDGTGYTVLQHFSGANGWGRKSALTLSGNVLFGTTYLGGDFDTGTIFRLNTDGTGGTVLKHMGVVSTEARIPSSGLTLSGSTLYGTTRAGGSSDAGTVFKLNTDGASYTAVKHFTGRDGSLPAGDLPLSDNVLYGTTQGGVGTGFAPSTVFKVNTDGTGHTVLHSFTDFYANPSSGVILSGGVLYGTTFQGGDWNSGMVFKVNADGTGFTVLKHFKAEGSGFWPYGGLTLSGNTLYGTTEHGLGTVFKINTDGTGYTMLKAFDYGTGGMHPRAGLTLSGDTLYGTTRAGGGPQAFVGYGTVFKINTDGSGFTVLKHFDGSDGRNPFAGVALSGSTLYGTTIYGGSSNLGTVFKVQTDGTGYAVLKHFTGGDGAHPSTSLTVSGSVLYGTTSRGGSWDNGTAFKIDLTPVLSIRLTAPNTVAVSWPSPSTGFVLQENRNGLSAVNWRNVTDPIQDDGSNLILMVNPADASRFYRLIRP